MNLNYFFIIAIFHLAITSILLILNWKSKRKSIFLNDYCKMICAFYHEKNEGYGFVVNIFLIIIYSLNDLFDSIYNLIKFLYNKENISKKSKIIRYKTAIELLSLFYLIITLSLWYWNNNIFCNEIVAAFFLYRISYILFFKVAEIVRTGRTEKNIGNISNFIRTFLLSLFNFVEITVGFSFLYFHTGILAKNNIDSIFFTLNLFTTMGVNNSVTICNDQKYIILFQIIVFFIFLTVFITNIANLKYMKYNEKNK